jgi:hypothetical protein
MSQFIPPSTPTPPESGADDTAAQKAEIEANIAHVTDDATPLLQPPPPGSPPGAPPPSVPPAPTNDPQRQANIAFTLELVAGWLYFLGLGYLYVGRTNDGLVRLVGWWVVLSLSYVVSAHGLCCVAPILHVAVPVWSAYTLRKKLLASASTVS